VREGRKAHRGWDALIYWGGVRIGAYPRGGQDSAHTLVTHLVEAAANQVTTLQVTPKKAMFRQFKKNITGTRQQQDAASVQQAHNRHKEAEMIT
jgi:hypothetical protein